MLLRIVFVSILVIISVYTQAQSEVRVPKNAIYAEFLGSAGYIYNLTYDRTLITQNQHHFSIALGTQFIKQNHVTISPQANYYLGRKRNFLELGAGYIKDFAAEEGDRVEGVVLRVGYRFQMMNGPFFKLAFTPVITNSISLFGSGYVPVPWAGISVGWAF